MMTDDSISHASIAVKPYDNLENQHNVDDEVSVITYKVLNFHFIISLEQISNRDEDRVDDLHVDLHHVDDLDLQLPCSIAPVLMY